MIPMIKELFIAALIGKLVHSQKAAESLELKQTADFITSYGYPAETHEVLTKDDYVLKIFRIPHSRSNSNRDRPIVLLQHGIILNSDSWVFRGPKEDLVFLLSDSGYDVWLSNSRGTNYSKHKKYSDTDPEFWNYSLTETGMYDMAAVIDHVLKATGRPHLTYVGHSRGNPMLVILLATQPEYNSKINLYIGLAPVIYTREAKTPFLRLAANAPFPVSSATSVQQIMKKAGVSNLFRTSRSMREAIKFVCNPLSIFKDICSSMVFLINGDDFLMYNRSLTPMIVARFTLGMSAKEYVHMLQVRESDKYRHFDHGRAGNLEMYGQEEPPGFDIGNVKVPAYLYYGPNDLFVSERDLFKFALQLPNVRDVYRIPFSKFNHIDYMWAKISNTILYPKLIKTIHEYNS